MLIKEVVQTIKNYHKGIGFDGNPIDEEKTRDKILYGDVDKECTGIVTTCFASSDVIRKAAELGANLIISHEALFWNHGDHTDWLADNKVFQAKKKLLDDTGITVWRDHDYIHSGIPVEGHGYVDGIFYGFMKEMHWEQYLASDIQRPMCYVMPATPAKEIARQFIDNFHLNGMRIIGDPDAMVKKIAIAGHIIGQIDNEVTAEVNKDDIDALITMELTDFTVNEYIRDAAMLGYPKAIIAMGHFNTEEPGMKYMTEYLPAVFGNTIPVHFVQSGDVYSFISK